MVKTESCALGWRELTLPLMWVSSPPPPTACCHPMNSIHSQQANYSRIIHNSLWMGNWVGSVLFLPSDHESFTFELQLPREKQWLKNCVADLEAYFICGCPEPHCLQILWSTSVTENLLAYKKKKKPKTSCVLSLAPSSSSYGLNLTKIYLEFVEMQESESIVLNCHGWLPHFLWIELYFFAMTWEPRVAWEWSSCHSLFEDNSGKLACSPSLSSSPGQWESLLQELIRPAQSFSFQKDRQRQSALGLRFSVSTHSFCPSPIFSLLNQQNLHK